METKTSLKDILFPTPEQAEKQVYESFFKMKMWSLHDFAALMVGFTPKQLKETHASVDLSVAKKNKARKILEQFTHDENSMKEHFYFINADYYGSPWKFIKWIAAYQIPIRKKFFNQLSPQLRELLVEFSPVNTAKRTSSKYHKSLFLQLAEELIVEEGVRSYQAIYEDLRAQNLLTSFYGPDWKPKKYEQRTITEVWLPELFEKLGLKPARGRPKMNPK